MIAGLGLFLVVSFAAFLTENDTIKIALSAAALSILFFSLIYFQLRFYREGDLKHVQREKKLASADISAAPAQLKSPHHRAIWENIDHTRKLMRHKEREFLQAQMKMEKRAIGLPEHEEIVFMADRSRFYIWPAALASMALLIIAASPSKELPSAFSFAFLVCGLLGLLALTAARFPNRYYLTNFRFLTRKKRPLGKEQWSSMNYPKISNISRRKNLASEQLTLKSDDGMIEVQGLSKHKLETMLGILRQNCPLATGY